MQEHIELLKDAIQEYLNDNHNMWRCSIYYKGLSESIFSIFIDDYYHFNILVDYDSQSSVISILNDITKIINDKFS